MGINKEIMIFEKPNQPLAPTSTFMLRLICNFVFGLFLIGIALRAGI